MINDRRYFVASTSQFGIISCADSCISVWFVHISVVDVDNVDLDRRTIVSQEGFDVLRMVCSQCAASQWAYTVTHTVAFDFRDDVWAYPLGRKLQVAVAMPALHGFLGMDPY